MKCIVGLGNPGEKYQYNRHNVGFMVVDKFGSSIVDGRWSMNKKFSAEIVQTKEYILVKPQTFMNDSGRAVTKISHFYKIKSTDLYVIHDDLDITLGEYKIQHAKGPRVHYGVNSIEKELGNENFWRVRVGVENREVRGNRGVAGEVYSLQDFMDEEKIIIGKVIEQIVDELRAVVSL
ncbi:MAG: aminoacyl-tRNA hydrolase [bacterium]